MLALIFNYKRLIELKVEILKVECKISVENLRKEAKYRKITKIILLILLVSYILGASTAMIYPLFSKTEFAMCLYFQLPWTKYIKNISTIIIKKNVLSFFFSVSSHPFYEINYLMVVYFAFFNTLMFIGKF